MSKKSSRKNAFATKYSNIKKMSCDTFSPTTGSKLRRTRLDENNARLAQQCADEDALQQSKKKHQYLESHPDSTMSVTERNIAKLVSKYNVSPILAKQYVLNAREKGHDPITYYLQFIAHRSNVYGHRRS